MITFRRWLHLIKQNRFWGVKMKNLNEIEIERSLGRPGFCCWRMLRAQPHPDWEIVHVYICIFAFVHYLLCTNIPFVAIFCAFFQRRFMYVLLLDASFPISKISMLCVTFSQFQTKAELENLLAILSLTHSHSHRCLFSAQIPLVTNVLCKRILWICVCFVCNQLKSML